MAATYVDGKPLVKWTQSQLENMGRSTLRDRATDLANALGVTNPPRHTEQCIQWMLEQQQELPSEAPPDDALAPVRRPSSRGRLASEEMRTRDLDARSEARQLDQYDPSVLSARNKARNMGYGLQMLGELPEEAPAVPAGLATLSVAPYDRSVLHRPGHVDDDPVPAVPGPIDNAASVAQRAKQRNAGSTDLLGQRVFPAEGSEPSRPTSPRPSSPGRGEAGDPVMELSQTQDFARSHWKRNTQGAGDIIGWR